MNGAQITFVGMLGADPELRFLANGSAVCNLNVAVGERRLNRQTGEWENGPTSWYRVNVWNRQAEFAAESFRRGSRVIVTGTIRQNEYLDRDGQTRYSFDVTADEIGASVRLGPVNIPRNGRAAAPDDAAGADPVAPVTPPPAPDGQGPTEPADGGPESPATAAGPRHATGKRGQAARTTTAAG